MTPTSPAEPLATTADTTVGQRATETPRSPRRAGKSERRPLRERKQRLLETEEEARNPTPPDDELLALACIGPTDAELDELFASIGLDFGAMQSEPGPATCGARTRRGAPCRALGLPNGRCKNHGGLSTGPRTNAGRARTLAGYRKWLSDKQKSSRSKPAGG
jgi:hypothetical protein